MNNQTQIQPPGQTDQRPGPQSSPNQTEVTKETKKGASPGSFADLFALDAVGTLDLATKGPTDAAARRILERSRELLQADAAYVRAEALLDRIKARRNRLATAVIPALMEEAQTDSIGVPGIGIDDPGVDIVLEDYVFASIKKEAENRDLAFAELERCGGGDLIQAVLNIKFAKEDLPRAKKLVKDVTDLLRSLFGNSEAPPVDLDLAVHHGSLTSWLKEELRKESLRAADGEDLRRPDLGLLGATVGRIAKIVKRRATRSSKKSRR